MVKVMEEWKSGMSTVISHTFRIILNAHVHVQANEDQLG